MKVNKIGEVWNSANRLLSDFIGLLSSKNFATMATWRNDFSSLYSLIDRMPEKFLEIIRYFALTWENEECMFWSSRSLADKKNNKHLLKTFFNLQKKLYPVFDFKIRLFVRMEEVLTEWQRAD